jgi:hypothetical protein
MAAVKLDYSFDSAKYIEIINYCGETKVEQRTIHTKQNNIGVIFCGGVLHILSGERLSVP